MKKCTFLLNLKVRYGFTRAIRGQCPELVESSPPFTLYFSDIHTLLIVAEVERRAAVLCHEGLFGIQCTRFCFVLFVVLVIREGRQRPRASDEITSSSSENKDNKKFWEDLMCPALFKVSLKYRS